MIPVLLQIFENVVWTSEKELSSLRVEWVPRDLKTTTI
jgi:hypothetical protein